MTSPLQPPADPQQIRDLIQGPADSEWRYEMRRDCQMIIPGLLLGPFQVSKELSKLQQLGVTHIVCIRDSKEAFSVKPRFEGHFTYLVLDVEDSEEQNLIRKFPEAREFIYGAINNGGIVLVHCNGGISLSPAFVVMFVMAHFSLSWEDALHMVQNRRYCISPNSGFLTQLKEYESIYRAQAAIQQNPGASGAPRLTRRKREEEEDEADETRYEERLPNSKRTQLDPEVVGVGLGLQLPRGTHDGDVPMDM
ncbi:phosphatases II [Exidia glandulosa HHB12029]|uniref:Phosphatases II n=1 Tax=Exidia glandulosa HHB12029 TaxID=1314781 RepID=A0A165P0T1_EXIGL|nr:phosphatases II [Exidia glandulosa HHB12029]